MLSDKTEYKFDILEGADAMIERFDIAGYCRISVDEKLNRDRSGYIFGQRSGCQAMRRGLVSHKKHLHYQKFLLLERTGMVELKDL